MKNLTREVKEEIYQIPPQYMGKGFIRVEYTFIGHNDVSYEAILFQEIEYDFTVAFYFDEKENQWQETCEDWGCLSTGEMLKGEVNPRLKRVSVSGNTSKGRSSYFFDYGFFSEKEFTIHHELVDSKLNYSSTPEWVLDKRDVFEKQNKKIRDGDTDYSECGKCGFYTTRVVKTLSKEEGVKIGGYDFHVHKEFQCSCGNKFLARETNNQREWNITSIERKNP